MTNGNDDAGAAAEWPAGKDSTFCRRMCVKGAFLVKRLLLPSPNLATLGGRRRVRSTQKRNFLHGGGVGVGRNVERENRRGKANLLRRLFPRRYSLPLLRYTSVVTIFSGGRRSRTSFP